MVVEGSAAPPAPVAQAPAPGGLRGLQIVANGLKWGVKTLTLRAGEKVRFTIVNQDDEKHNLISPETGLLPPASPDVDGGRSATFEWTVPNKPGRFKFTCIYHPAMVIDVTIQ